MTRETHEGKYYQIAPLGKTRQDTFIYRAHFVHKAIQSASQLHRIPRSKHIKSVKQNQLH